MSTLLTDLGAVVTAVVGYIPTMVTTVTGNPLLLLGFGLMLLGAGVGLFRRLA